MSEQENIREIEQRLSKREQTLAYQNRHLLGYGPFISQEDFLRQEMANKICPEQECAVCEECVPITELNCERICQECHAKYEQGYQYPYRKGGKWRI